MTRATGALLLLLAGAFLLRVRDASRAQLEFIERDEYIPAALTLSRDHHPIRLAQHGALPAYAVRLSGEVFGRSTLGWRMLSILVGTATILLLYLIAARWWGPVAGFVAGGLLAVDRYHATISARAIDLPLDLFFIALAMYGFSRFLAAQDSEPGSGGRWLYLTAAASAAGFLCKELTALLVPVLFLSLLSTGQAGWLRRRQTWLALGLFAVLIAPDIHSSLTTSREERVDLWRRHQAAAAQIGVTVDAEGYQENGLYMSYGDQLSRFRGIGPNKEALYFYFGSIFDRLGIPHKNGFAEFPFMYPVLGVVLWIAVFCTLFQRKDRLSRFALVMFFGMLLPFTLVRLGRPHAAFPAEAEVLWYWADRSMLPALLLAGRAAALVTDRLRKRA
jgi:4-amino-4-deoxy-L-arabinose transferase-like glycosyltransferase